MTSIKPDFRRAQGIIRDAVKEAALECGITDPMELCAIVSACHSAIASEVAPSDLLMKWGGIEHTAEVFAGQLRDFLMTDLIARAKHERRKARH